VVRGLRKRTTEETKTLQSSRKKHGPAVSNNGSDKRDFGGRLFVTRFEHRRDDVVYTVRFRRDVASYLDSKMRKTRWHPNKRQVGTAEGMIKKSIHSVLDEEIRKLMKK